MAYDEDLASRIRRALAGRRGVSEKRMFGGLSFLVRGHMICGVVGQTLMVRVGPGAYERMLARPHVREMDFTGRPLRGMVYVDGAGVRTAKQLATWVERGIAFAGSLPPK
jgi:TfoX/Sxy family transcriptional regulator of competence genes